MGVPLAPPSPPEPDKRPRIVEIVGPAGAGKTTLLEALQKASPKIHAVRGLRRADYLPWFVVGAFKGAPVWLRRCAWRRLGWPEMMMTVHLEALHHIVPGRPHGRTVAVFDQGPVFMLTRLFTAGVEARGDEKIRMWWAAMITRWAVRVDRVIWLDAPDTVLVARIRTREKWHVTKDQSDHDAYSFLRSFRSASDAILTRLGCVGAGRLLAFDTSQVGVSEIVGTVLDDRVGSGPPVAYPLRRERCAATPE